MLKTLLKREGYFDFAPSMGNKRVLFVGINVFSDYYYCYHDLISRGIPFHISTYTDFFLKYDTEEWKSAYDIVVLGGTYMAGDTATPSGIRSAVEDILENGKYKLIQVGYLGMVKDGEPNAYWYESFGVNTYGDGSAEGTEFTSPDAVVNNAVYDVVVDGTSYQVLGWCTNMYGSGLTGLACAAQNASHWFAAALPGRAGAIIGIQSGLDYVFNTAVDLGKIVWYLRGFNSHLCYNRIYGKKYVAWGWDCDQTGDTAAIGRILQVSGDRPVELGIVTGRMTEQAMEYYQTIQAQGQAKIVSHTHKHFDGTIPSSYEFILGVENCAAMGLEADGIIYQTGAYNDPSIFKEAVEMGYLICGYLYGPFGRSNAYIPLGGKEDMLKTSYRITPFPVKDGSILAKTPVMGTTCTDDILNMTTYQASAYNEFVMVMNRADTYPYDLPMVFYFHDSPLVDNWNPPEWAGKYYDIANGMNRRLQYYNGIFSHIDGLGYKQLQRSAAMDLIYDIMNCASVTSETITAEAVTTKIVSKRRISGLTVAVPTDITKSLVEVRIDGGIINSSLYERSGDSKWLYVSVEALPAREHVIVVTYA
ncbi:MAG TPA: hypothetical protein VN580_00065 [Clostridia bacterium]|nr:hypothetical protein [Clostridia bacterium]